MISINSLRLFVAVVALINTIGCGGGKIPTTNYYTLNLAAPTPATDRLEHTAILMPFRATKVVNQDRIVYRETREQVGFYEYHRWAEDPRSEIADALAEALLAKGTFRSVTDFDGRSKADFILRGQIERLEEVDYDSPVEAAVEISVELVDADTAKVVWSESATKTGAVTTGNVGSVVSGMSAAAGQGIAELAAKLDGFVRSL